VDATLDKTLLEKFDRVVSDDERAERLWTAMRRGDKDALKLVGALLEDPIVAKGEGNVSTVTDHYTVEELANAFSLKRDATNLDPQMGSRLTRLVAAE
jgi:hypothetical protein